MLEVSRNVANCGNCFYLSREDPIYGRPTCWWADTPIDQMDSCTPGITQPRKKLDSVEMFDYAKKTSPRFAEQAERHFQMINAGITPQRPLRIPYSIRLGHFACKYLVPPAGMALQITSGFLEAAQNQTSR